MRKILSLMLVIVLLAPLAFAGGQGESGATEQRELVINSNLSDPAPRAAFQTLVERFEAEYPDIEVTLNTFDHEAYKTAIRNFLASDPPDVALWFAGNRMRFFVEQGLVMDITDLWEDAGFTETMASSRAAFTVDGSLYGVPWGYYQWGVFYRQDLFDQYGIAVPETWDEFMAAGRTLRANGITPVSIGTRFLWTAAGWFDYLNLRINGYDFHIELTNGEVPYTDPRLDAVFDAWRELIEEGFFLENHATYSWQEAQAPFINGQAAMYLIGNFIVPDLDSAGILDNVGFFQFPVINPSVGIYEDAPTEAYLIPSGAENVEEAKLFLEFASRADVLADFAYEVGNIPPNNQSRAPEDRFTVAGFEMLNAADGLAQFYDRDTSPEMASVGMQGFQEFMVNPDREDAIRQRLETERQRIFQ
jgi:multiple sugar transport system substrate-binding protein